MRMSKYLVAIDAGHSMHTEGKQSVPMSKDLYINGELARAKGKIIKENEQNRGVSEYLSVALKRCGIDTMFTADMTGKKDIPLSTRASKAISLLENISEYIPIPQGLKDVLIQLRDEKK